MKKEISVRAGVVLQLTLIAVASLSLLAVFSFRVIGITLERRHMEAAVSVTEVVRQAVVEASAQGVPDPVSRIRLIAGSSPYLLQVSISPEAPPGGDVVVTPVGEAISVLLPIHPTVDVTLPLVVPVPLPGNPAGLARSLRIRFHSSGIEREVSRLVRVAALLLGVDVVALVVFGFFLMERSVVGPVRRLAAVSEKIASGDLDLRAAESPGNEVGQLGASFNRMVEAILEAQSRTRIAQQDAFRSEKLATVGRLVAGVAHEVGNPLMAVRGYAEYLRKNHPPDEEGDECLGKILAETRRIETIVRGLLSAASPERPGEGTAEIHGIMREVVQSLSVRKIFREITVRIEEGDIPRARISPERFRQVLLNLITNAIDAMGQEGELTLRTFPMPSWTGPRLRRARRRASDPPDADFSSRGAGDTRRTGTGIGLSVEDNGCGIPGKELEGIFDPFYTTKEPGKGTGLGLYLSRTIVEAAGGEIRCESEEGKGTRFTLVLPAAEGNRGGATAEKEEPHG